MIIYHGSNIEVSCPVVRKGKFTKDFGDGFYCTQIKEQAERWANKFDTPIISSYEYANTKSLNIVIFEEMTDEWL